MTVIAFACFVVVPDHTNIALDIGEPVFETMVSPRHFARKLPDNDLNEAILVHRHFVRLDNFGLHVVNHTNAPTVVNHSNTLPLFQLDHAAAVVRSGARPEERRVGKEWVSQGRSRWSPYH